MGVGMQCTQEDPAKICRLCRCRSRSCTNASQRGDIAKDAQTALLGLCQELLVAVSKFRSCVLVCWYLCRT